MTTVQMERRLRRVEAMNDLADLRSDEVREAHERTRHTDPKKDSKGSGDSGGLFGAASQMFFSRNGTPRARIAGITHPSDGHPQQEHCPDFGWFRPLSFNNQTWVLYWPELTI